jgi:hypothetical protein
VESTKSTSGETESGRDSPMSEDPIDHAIRTLREAGLYARKHEGIPEDLLIVGGSHTVDAGGGITLIQNVFHIDVTQSEGTGTPTGFLVRYPADRGQLSEEVPFATFPETITFVLQRWSPMAPPRESETPRETGRTP